MWLRYIILNSFLVPCRYLVGQRLVNYERKMSRSTSESYSTSS